MALSSVGGLLGGLANQTGLWTQQINSTFVSGLPEQQWTRNADPHIELLKRHLKKAKESFRESLQDETNEWLGRW